MKSIQKAVKLVPPYSSNAVLDITRGVKAKGKRGCFIYRIYMHCSSHIHVQMLNI